MSAVAVEVAHPPDHAGGGAPRFRHWDLRGHPEPIAAAMLPFLGGV